jgi:hypothetical protein
VPAFPIPKQNLTVFTNFLGNLTAAAAEVWKLRSELFIQLEQLHEAASRSLFSEHAREWIPEVGLGVWPDRDPPAGWTREEFMNAGPEERLRPLMYQVFRITTSLPTKDHARNLMLVFGPVLEILTSDSEAFLSKTKAVLVSPIKDPSYACYPFYVPLLEGKTLTAATGEQLEAWLSAATIYIRESFEDQGILIASREPLTRILKELGGEFEERPAAWRIPIGRS